MFPTQIQPTVINIFSFHSQCHFVRFFYLSFCCNPWFFLRNLLSLVVLFQYFIFFFNFSFSVHSQRLFLPIPSFHHQQFRHCILSVLLIMVCKYDENSLIVNFWIFLKKLVLNLPKTRKI